MMTRLHGRLGNEKKNENEDVKKEVIKDKKSEAEIKLINEKNKKELLKNENKLLKEFGENNTKEIE